MRILVANEPRSYRESIAESIRGLRPNAEVKVVSPPGLDGWVQRFAPDMVICSRATDTVRARVLTWVELYTEEGTTSTVNIGDRRCNVENMELSDLLDLIDKTSELIQLG